MSTCGVRVGVRQWDWAAERDPASLKDPVSLFLHPTPMHSIHAGPSIGCEEQVFREKQSGRKVWKVTVVIPPFLWPPIKAKWVSCEMSR